MPASAHGNVVAGVASCLVSGLEKLCEGEIRWR